MTIGTRYHIIDCVGNSYGTAKTYGAALTLAKTFLYITDDDTPEKHVIAKVDFDDEVESVLSSWHINDADGTMLMSAKGGDSDD